MKDPTGTVRMCGVKMEILLEAGCVTSFTPAAAAKLPGIMNRLCKSLSIRPVARYFINDVRIGETVALVDKGNGYTYRIRMEVHAVRVLEIYENRHHPEDDTPAVYLVDWGLLRSIAGVKAVAA